MLHLCVGLTIWVASAALLRRPLRSGVPAGIVVAAEAGNEFLDRLATGSWNWADTTVDFAATCSWPVILAALLADLPRLRA